MTRYKLSNVDGTHAVLKGTLIEVDGDQGVIYHVGTKMYLDTNVQGWYSTPFGIIAMLRKQAMDDYHRRSVELDKLESSFTNNGSEVQI